MNKIQIKNKRGAALVTVAVGIFILIACSAIAIDYGMMAVVANQAQRASDAAALAGAVKLIDNTSNSKSMATEEAKRVASLNGITITDSDISFPGDYLCRVDITRPVALLLGGVITGNGSGKVKRHSTAEYGFIEAVSGGMPLAMTQGDYDSFKAGTEEFTLKLIRNQSTDFEEGNVMGLDAHPNTDNSSKSLFHWIEALQSGSTELYDTSINDDGTFNEGSELSINAAESNQGRNMVDVLSARASGEYGGKYTTMVITDPAERVVGNSPHPLKGLVGVEIVSSQTGVETTTVETSRGTRTVNTTTYNVTIRILKEDELFHLARITQRAGTAVGTTNTNTNIRIVRLVDDLN